MSDRFTIYDGQAHYFGSTLPPAPDLIKAAKADELEKAWHDANARGAELEATARAAARDLREAEKKAVRGEATGDEVAAARSAVVTAKADVAANGRAARTALETMDAAIDAYMADPVRRVPDAACDATKAQADLVAAFAQVRDAFERRESAYKRAGWPQVAAGTWRAAFPFGNSLSPESKAREILSSFAPVVKDFPADLSEPSVDLREREARATANAMKASMG